MSDINEKLKLISGIFGDYNPNRHPAGSTKGGQFAPGKARGGGARAGGASAGAGAGGVSSKTVSKAYSDLKEAQRAYANGGGYEGQQKMNKAAVKLRKAEIEAGVPLYKSKMLEPDNHEPEVAPLVTKLKAQLRREESTLSKATSAASGTDSDLKNKLAVRLDSNRMTRSKIMSQITGIEAEMQIDWDRKYKDRSLKLLGPILHL